MFGTETAALLNTSKIELPQLVMARSLRHDLDELVSAALGSSKVAVVDDSDTAQAAGDLVFSALKLSHHAARITLSKRPHADRETVERIRAQSKSCDALVAVGSGTINDLCKYASYLDGKPYIVFPTAASMNGYLSANASITENGYKKTFAAHMPVGVFCDLSIITAAPARLSKSGFGDSLARSTAQADWLLSHLLLGTEYKELPFTLLATLEPQLLENARGIAKADPQSIELLMQTLLLSGLGMTIAGGSYPASQGEHMIAHAYEMLSDDDTSLHGEQIAVTTLMMAAMQERLLHTVPTLRSMRFDEEVILSLFGEHTAKEARQAFAKKAALAERASLKDGWDTVAARLESVRIPPARLRTILEAAEAATAAPMLGWDDTLLAQAATSARYLRDRFTFLDLQ